MTYTSEVESNGFVSNCDGGVLLGSDSIAVVDRKKSEGRSQYRKEYSNNTDNSIPNALGSAPGVARFDCLDRSKYYLVSGSDISWLRGLITCTMLQMRKMDTYEFELNYKYVDGLIDCLARLVPDINISMVDTFRVELLELRHTR